MTFTPIDPSHFTVSSTGDIRAVAGAQNYTILALHTWLQSMASSSTKASADDEVYILSSNPSRLDGPRSDTKPMVLNLLAPYNIDDITARRFYFGSIYVQSTATLYTGVGTLGSPLVPFSPIYGVQNGVKLFKHWTDVGHIQILVKSIGPVDIFSRKYGQTYSNFPVALTAGSEQPAAISTALTDWTTLTKAEALAVTGVSIAIGNVTTAPVGVTPARLYKGTITITGDTTVLQAAQYLQAITAEDSEVMINGVEGWRFTGLTGYTPNSVAPFGHVAGGKWFVAQGWWVQHNSSASGTDSQLYEMIADDNFVVKNPVTVSIQIKNLIDGVQVIVGRDAGGDAMVTNEYELFAATTAVGNTCVMKVTTPIKADTPDSGYIRVNGYPYSYVNVDRGTRTFTISGTWGRIHNAGSFAFCPFIDATASGGIPFLNSPNFARDAKFNARVIARKALASPYLKPANAPFEVDSGQASFSVQMDSDE